MKGTVVLVIALLLTAPLVTAKIENLQITVYPDGYALVNETVSTNSTAAVVDLLGTHVEGLIVTDAAGNPVPYQLNNTKLIAFPNSTTITVSYYTPDLTIKNGPIWTFRITAPRQFTLILPENAVVVGISSVPLEVKNNKLILPLGKQNVSYVLQIASQRKTSEKKITMGISEPGKNYIPLAVGGTSAVILAFAIATTRKRKKEIPEDWLLKVSEKYNLNQEEIRALHYLLQHEGRARQSEIREALGIPKTTAWRMFQRLEKLGLVRIKKVGRENWVEITP